MKIKPAQPKREKRPQPLSFRLSKIAVKQLNELKKATGKSMTAIVEEVIEAAYRDTLKR